MTSTTIERPARTRSFTAVVPLSASPATVLAALTTLDGLAAWWAPVTGDPGAGGELTFTFSTHGTNTVRVLSSGPTEVVWESIVSEPAPEWVGTRMVWEIAPDSTGSELRFTHLGLTPELDCYDDCHSGWSHFVASIAGYVDRGVGMPHGS